MMVMVMVMVGELVPLGLGLGLLVFGLLGRPGKKFLIARIGRSGPAHIIPSGLAPKVQLFKFPLFETNKQNREYPFVCLYFCRTRTVLF